MTILVPDSFTLNVLDKKHASVGKDLYFLNVLVVTLQSEKLSSGLIFFRAKKVTFFEWPPVEHIV